MIQDGRQRTHADATRGRRIACLSAAPWNPYLRLLYGHLGLQGFDVVDDPRLSLRWLWRSRSSVTFLHFHWPEGFYRHERGPTRLRPLLSRLKLGLFAIRLAASRALGYRLVWTVHQVFPHESINRGLERRAARLLGWACHLLVAHDEWTAGQARSELRKPSAAIVVLPHGSYIGVYPEGRARAEVRSELGLPQDSFVFLSFGELRAYKGIDLLLAAFSSVALPDARLVVAGNAKDSRVGAALRAASRDPRVTALLGFVPEERVAELFHACDAAVVARSDGGTSGSLVLALSLGIPVVVADVETARELTRAGEAGWLFRPHDVTSLRAALDEAASDASEARARGRQGLAIAEDLRWTEIAQDLARLLDRLDHSRGGARSPA